MSHRTPSRLFAAAVLTVMGGLAIRAHALGQASMPTVHARFDLSQPGTAPFPSDMYTVTDETTNSGLRVDLPLPDCVAQRSDCEDVQVVNSLDGFNLQPRLSIPFDGPIDVTSVSSRTIFLVKIANGSSEQASSPVIGINQIVWDPSANTLHVESDQLLEQHTRYALVVSSGLHDPEGRPIEASEELLQFRHDLNFGLSQDPGVKTYRKALLDGLGAARAAGVHEGDIVDISVFTTQSTTATLEKIRDQIHESTPAPAEFVLGSGGERTVFPLDSMTSINWRQQTHAQGPLTQPVAVNLSLLRVIPGAVGRIAFGKYQSPDYEVHPGEFIPAVGSRTGMPVVQGMNDVYFMLVLPSGAAPAGGWPVAIYGHGGAASKEGAGGVLNVAAAMAERGVATIGIDIVGHGFGPEGTLTVTTSAAAAPVTFKSGGRGVDQNGDGIIESREGMVAAPPRSIIGDRDGFRQTVADLMQLVRTIQVGVDVDDDGVPDLDSSRIYYFGWSLSGMYGTSFLAVEPDIQAGVLIAPGGPRTSRRLNNAGDRPLLGSYLAARMPSLINAPGVTQLGGVSIAGLPRFHENMPLRNDVPLTVTLEDGTTHTVQSPVVNTVSGAIAIQEYFERAEWVMQSADAVSWSPHLRKAPLPGTRIRPLILQFARADQTVPNPATTAMLLAGDLADRTMLYRHDLASAERPALPKNPHPFAVGLAPAAGFLDIGLAVQRQIATFFASNGTVIIHPEPARFFEVPIRSPLPEDLGYIR